MNIHWGHDGIGRAEDQRRLYLRVGTIARLGTARAWTVRGPSPLDGDTP